MIFELMNHDSRITIFGTCLESIFKIVIMIGSTRNPSTTLTNAITFFSLSLMLMLSLG